MGQSVSACGFVTRDRDRIECESQAPRLDRSGDNRSPYRHGSRPCYHRMVTSGEGCVAAVSGRHFDAAQGYLQGRWIPWNGAAAQQVELGDATWTFRLA